MEDGVFNENNRRKIWNVSMEKIINEENEWDHLTEADTVEGSIEMVTHKEIVQTIKGMKP